MRPDRKMLTNFWRGLFTNFLSKQAATSYHHGRAPFTPRKLRKINIINKYPRGIILFTEWGILGIDYVGLMQKRKMKQKKSSLSAL